MEYCWYIMKYCWYIFSSIPAIISIIGVIYCVVHGKGISHKILVCFASLWCLVFLVCFGGNVVLSFFDMGWHCTPFNTMLKLCCVLSIPTLLCGIKVLFSIKVSDWRYEAIGVISMALALIVIPISSGLYFEFTSCDDSFTEYENQTILVASNGHGSYGYIWHYYIPINDLVHGAEITQDGWHGVRPWERTS